MEESQLKPLKQLIKYLNLLKEEEKWIILEKEKYLKIKEELELFMKFFKIKLLIKKY